MMKLTYLAHSGCFLELDSACFLFDWWKGELPPLPDKPLFVFASHAHSDHFNPAIFGLDDGSREIHFLLGHDIHLSPSRREKWGVSEETAAKCTRMRGSERLELPGMTVETLSSTDEGVAFLVTAEGKTIFHAGDLNWWHWEGEPDPWNPDMARNFKAYAEPLRGRHLDLAMLPLDPRLEENGFLGPDYFLNLAEVERFFPIHLWRKFAFVEEFLGRHPEYREKTLLPTADEQVFEL